HDPLISLLIRLPLSLQLLHISHILPLLPYPLFTSIFFFFNDPATPEIYTLSLHDALPISARTAGIPLDPVVAPSSGRLLRVPPRSEEHTSELQSRGHLVCRLLLEKKKEQWRVLNEPMRVLPAVMQPLSDYVSVCSWVVTCR